MSYEKASDYVFNNYRNTANTNGKDFDYCVIYNLCKKDQREKQVKEQEERITREEPLPKNP